MFSTAIDVVDLAAELALLERFDLERHVAGHDYGAGQRGAELSRRRLELSGLGADVEPALDAVTAAELVGAFERVARPRIARIEREDFRRSTPATRRTLETWRRLGAATLVDAGIEAGA